jgi:hypothetical protein
LCCCGISLLSPGHITEDLLRAGNAQSSEPISSVVAVATNQPPLAKSLTPDQKGPLPAGLTIIWTGKLTIQMEIAVVSVLVESASDRKYLENDDRLERE